MIAALPLRSGDFCFAQATASGSDAPPRCIAAFEKAVALSIDQTGNLYVLDEAKTMLYKLSPRGDILLATGGYGWQEGSFNRPTDVAISNGMDIFIADNGNHRVERFDRNLNFVSTLSGTDDPSNRLRFEYPTSVAVSRDGWLFILDRDNRRIVKYSNDQLDQTIGDFNAGEGRLHAPTRMRIDQNDKLYVADGSSLVTYDLFGNYLGTIPASMAMKAFAVTDSVLVILDSCSIHTRALFTGGEDHDRQVDLTSIDCSGIDVGMWRDAVYLLTPKCLYMLQTPFK